MDTTSQGRPTEIKVPTRPGLEKGRDLAASSGCLACHRIGGSGNAGPGSNLTRVGRRLDRAEIERVLVDPEPPMPSYEGIGRANRREIARYLASLR